MAVKFLQVNQPTLLQHFDEVTTIYVKQYGPGNLRLHSMGDVLLQTVSDPIPDGITQVTASGINGWVQYFWKGDLWTISDAAGGVAWIASAYQFYIERQTASQPVLTDGEIEGDLSTYGRFLR